MKDKDRVDLEVELEETDSRTEHEDLLLEREKLELEKLRRDVAIIREEQTRRKQIHTSNESSIADQIARERALQNTCSHMKGGTGESLLGGAPGSGAGTPGGYSIIKHTFGNGTTLVLCQRCQREWWPGNEGYRQMVTAPTTNSPSTSAFHIGLVSDPKYKQTKSRN